MRFLKIAWCGNNVRSAWGWRVEFTQMKITLLLEHVKLVFIYFCILYYDMLYIFTMRSTRAQIKMEAGMYARYKCCIGLNFEKRESKGKNTSAHSHAAAIRTHAIKSMVEQFYSGRRARTITRTVQRNVKTTRCEQVERCATTVRTILVFLLLGKSPVYIL